MIQLTYKMKGGTNNKETATTYYPPSHVVVEKISICPTECKEVSNINAISL